MVVPVTGFIASASGRVSSYAAIPITEAVNIPSTPAESREVIL
jgi:hypothetical protein